MARDPYPSFTGSPAVTFRVMAGEPVTGKWCATCLLPSVISVPIHLLSESGVTLHGYAEQCGTCEDKPRLVRYSGEG